MTSLKRKRLIPSRLTLDAIGSSDMLPSPLLEPSDAFQECPQLSNDRVCDEQIFSSWKTLYSAMLVDAPTVVLVSLGRIDAAVDVSLLLIYLHVFFPALNIQMGADVDIDALKLQSRRGHPLCEQKYLESHFQFCVSQFDQPLIQIRSQIEPRPLAVIGMTMADLHQDSLDEYIVGSAHANFGIAVFSFARYQPDFESKAKKPEFCKASTSPFANPLLSQEEAQLQTTLAACKTLTHEILHLFGIKHCVFAACLMNASGSLKEDLDTPMFLCPVDLHKLAFVLTRIAGKPVDLVQRYNKMADILSLLGAAAEVEWLEERIASVAK